MRAGHRIGIQRPWGGSPQLQLSAPYAHRPAQPSPARGYLSHTSTPNRRWQNREWYQQVPISPAVISSTAGRRGIQRESPSNLTNGQETGKMFQRKLFHVLTVFFRLVRRFLLRRVIRAIGFSASATF